MIDGHAEGLGHGIRCDIVMRRADAAGGEDIGVTASERIHCRHDVVLDIRNNAGFLEIDAERGEIIGEEAQVLVLGAAREDFIADEENGGGRRVSVHGAALDCDDLCHPSGGLSS